MMFPSRKTGTPKSGRTADATREASNCNGKVIWLKMMAGIGIIKIKNAHGNKMALKMFHPKKSNVIPAATKRREKRERKSSAPNWPTISAQIPSTSTGRPSHDGSDGIRASRPRCRQSRNAENKGTKNPWEKLGSRHHCETKWSSVGPKSHTTIAVIMPSCRTSVGGIRSDSSRTDPTSD